jgi:hypothetical protein
MSLGRLCGFLSIVPVVDDMFCHASGAAFDPDKKQ